MGGLVKIILSLLLFTLLTEAVDKKAFKTCQQSAFCRRNRRLSDQPRTSRYALLEETLSHGSGVITADILNHDNGVLFNFQLSLFQGNQAHFQITEKAPLYNRYMVQDVIVKKPSLTSFEKSKEDGSIIIQFEKNKLVLQPSPFRLDFFVGEEPVISVNSRGLFNFEHSRKKRQAEGEQDPVLAEELRLEEQQGKDDGYWDEEFKGHQDQKPNGPTAVALDFTFPGSKAVYGIPEHAVSLALKPTKGPGLDSDPYRLYNLDVFEYELDVPMALYGAIPYMISHKPGHTVGVLWLNAAETWVDVSQSQEGFWSKFIGTPQSHIDTHWISESGIIDVYIFLGPSPRDLFRQYSSLTGTTALPPSFSIAYHQCRWNYIDEPDVEKVDQGFDDHDIPYDVLWLDIEHTDSKKFFTWDPIKFPNPQKMQKGLSDKRRKMVTIVDPHIKRDNNYYIHNEATSLDLYVKTKDGQAFDGHCWPGSSSWVDFTNPKARDWWANKFALSDYKGSSLDLYTWNDMNEPSVFNGPEVTMHKHNIHHNGIEHRDVHNLYGFYQHMATAEGLKRRNNQRPFVLTRSFFSGSQRFGAVWTGDNAAEWSHLAITLPMILSLGVAGFPFAGSDVGGFFGNPGSELFVRWYQTGAFNPFFRGHAHLDTKRREPWLKGEPYTSHIRHAIRTRYTLLPLWYTVFHEASIEGTPIVRPLFIEYPDDPATFTMDDQLLVGNHILVKPVVAEGVSSISAYLPGTNQVWYDYDTFQAEVGPKSVVVQTPLSKIPAFIRGGAVIPKKERIRRSSSLMENDPYTLVVALDLQGKASGDLYLDDGKSFDHQKGIFTWKTISFDQNVIKSSDRLAGGNRFPNQVEVERIVIVGLQQAPSKVTNPSNESLYFTYFPQSKHLVIKKPNVRINDDWEIKLS